MVILGCSSVTVLLLVDKDQNAIVGSAHLYPGPYPRANHDEGHPKISESETCFVPKPIEKVGKLLAQWRSKYA